MKISTIIMAVLMVLVPNISNAENPSGSIAMSPPRHWEAGEKNSSIHCLGNGRLCVYEKGPEVVQLFGAPYSTTTIGAIIPAAEAASCVSRRVTGTAVWEHCLSSAGKPVCTFTDIVDSAMPCFVRHINASAPLEFVYQPAPDLRHADNSGMMQQKGAAGGFLIETPIGKPSVPFGNYPIPFAFFHQFAWTGNVEVVRDDATERIHFRVGPGESTLFVTGGPDLDAVMTDMAGALTTGFPAMLTRTRAWWEAFTASGRDWNAELPEGVPMRDRLVQVLDDVAVLIKAQQAVEGGVMAGYPYHLGYVRDQYGTHRGLVALGHEEMSRSILEFYFDVFQRFGMIRNAQAFGIPGLFHVHENDDVEITGYITLQAFDYLKRSGDTAFVRKLFPMLEWAWKAQQRHLVKGMLPFNGDETYVAGGILPRSALNDGSAEATMLFIDSGKLLLDFAAEQGLWDDAGIARERNTLERVKSLFRENFWRDGRLITNNPARCADTAALPRVRHGVCEACVTVQWTLRTENNRYLCIDCFDTKPLPAIAGKVYDLQSVSLTPIYFHSDLITGEMLRPQVEAIVRRYRETGQLPSRPEGNRAVGYDYGLLLYALTELGDPMAEELFVKTLELADDTGAWAEYYIEHQPYGTRCRPWESAINVEALLHWIEKEYSGE